MPTRETPATPRSGVRQRCMAWLLARNGDQMHRMFGDRKQQLLAGLDGHVVEIGPGAGANFRYLDPKVTWMGVEPNTHNLPALIAEAERYGIRAETQVGYAEALPLEDASADHVVTTLVLCSVRDVARTLAEVRRVLKPGGSYVFLEHVAATHGTLTRRLQDALAPAWGFVADGCHPNRELGSAIQQAGLQVDTFEAFDVSLPLVRPHISGVARKT